jgi:hypothetical protein
MGVRDRAREKWVAHEIVLPDTGQVDEALAARTRAAGKRASAGS